MAWVKLPELAARLARLSPEVRWTYVAAFYRARRQPPRLGWLMDGDRPATIPILAAWASIPRSTAYRHTELLLSQGLLIRDLLGRYLVPLVIEVERQSRRRNDDEDDDAAANGSPKERSQAVQNALLLPVENRGGAPPPRPMDGQKSRLVGRPLLVVEKQNVRDVRPSPIDDKPGDNPDVLAALSATDVPLSSDRARYLLGRLAASSSAWRRLIEDPGEHRVLAALERQHPAALLSGLESAILGSTQVRNAGAWLTATVRAIVAEAQVG